MPDAGESFVGVFSFHDFAQAADAVRYLKALSGPLRRKLREDASLSRKDMAERLCVSPARLGAFEAGTLPTGEEAVRYACALKALLPPPDNRLNAEERQRVLDYFANNEVCPNCRGVHNRACPRVRTVSYHDNGTLRSVEYWPDGQWPQDSVIFSDSPEMNHD